MPISQNATFTGQPPPDEEFDHPPGASIGRLLQSQLAERDWETTPIEDWRDSGWCIWCTRTGAELEVVVASMGDDDTWFLQIGATHQPGIIGSLFGKVASADSNAILALAKDAHDVLSTDIYSDFKWCWDGPPDGPDATPEPAPL